MAAALRSVAAAWSRSPSTRCTSCKNTFGYEQVTKFNRQDGRDTTAVETCGRAPAYDLWGETSDPQPDAHCADCGELLVEDAS